jgi:predicted fused transcriptional regulator/phosphomethylpyrimidine kinase/predicted transcriptional regulator
MMTDSFLPSMRKMVALKLRDQGFSQGRIASMLGVTQASVSLYLKRGGRRQLPLDALGVSSDEAELYASLLAEDLKKDPVYAVNTLYSIWSDILGRGAMCSTHRSQYPILAKCDMCMSVFPGRAHGSEGGAIEQVAEAVRAIEGSSIFVKVMPEVSVNIAYAGPNASSVREVVAVPGRIVRVRGMPRSFMRPEFGASTHLAGILLAVKSHDHSVRGAMNLRYDGKMERALASQDIRHVTLDPSQASRTDADLLASLDEKLRDTPGPIEAIVDRGGPGIEPGLYLFGADASRVAQIGLRLARAYVGEG